MDEIKAAHELVIRAAREAGYEIPPHSIQKGRGMKSYSKTYLSAPEKNKIVIGEKNIEWYLEHNAITEYSNTAWIYPYNRHTIVDIEGFTWKYGIKFNDRKELLTFVIAHELSHLINHTLHGARVKPHGIEFQIIYRNIIKNLLSK